jgi:hypothetical protein
MNYNEVIQKSLEVRWMVGMCQDGKSCWCRTIRAETPLLFKENRHGDEDEYWIVRPGELNRETVEHIVKIHNEWLENKTK